MRAMWLFICCDHCSDTRDLLTGGADVQVYHNNLVIPHLGYLYKVLVNFLGENRETKRTFSLGR